MIADKRLTPGSKLPPERELSETLGISRSSMREAIRALTHLNILETRHGQGTYVTALSPRELIQPLSFVMVVEGDLIYQLFEARKIIESGVAALAATRITEEQLDELQRDYELLIQSIDDPQQFLEYDVAMHELIFHASGNEVLLSLLKSVFELLLESRNRTGAIAAVRAQTIIDHREILQALQARDPERSSRTMIEHLTHVEDKLKEMGGPNATPRVRQVDPEVS